MLALATAIVTAVASYFKNISQDKRVIELTEHVDVLQAKIEKCEKHRSALVKKARSRAKTNPKNKRRS